MEWSPNRSRAQGENMDLGKLRAAKGNPGDTDEASPSGNGKRDLIRTNPKNITETRAYKEGKAGIGQMWSNYLRVLGSYFHKMRREDQEQLIVRFCQVVTVGCAVVLTSFFYQFVPSLVKVFALPLFFVGTWFVATRVVSPIIIAQFESKLNPFDE